MFAVILGAGLFLILAEVKFTQLLLLMAVLVFLLPFLLGSVTVAEVRAGIGQLRTIPVLKKLDSIKLFEKKDQKSDAKPAAAPPKVSQDLQPAKKDAPGAPGKGKGIGSRMKGILDSISSLGAVIRERRQRGKKPEEIEKLLDSAVLEKVPRVSPAVSSGGAGTSASGVAVPGPSSRAGTNEDPFFSLSNDEFDPGLLEGLEDIDPPSAGSGPVETSSHPSGDAVPGASVDALDAEAAAILQANAGIPEDPESLPAPGEDDGISDDLGDLDSLSLDGIEFDDEESAAPAAPAAAASASAPGDSAPAPVKAVPESGPGVMEVKADWIQSDGINLQDEISTQADMAAFSSGSGTDDDLLSSLASDIKHVAKQVDISLVRDLKDFRAPAKDIEDELSALQKRLNAIPRPQEKTEPAPKNTNSRG